MKKIMLPALLSVCFLTANPIYAQNNRPANNNVQDMEIFYHTVETGQTVFSIARLYDVMVIDIHRLNPGSEEVIRAGQQLKIPQRRFEEKSILNIQADDNHTIHTIREGENIFRLSRQYGVTEDQILRANPGLTNATFTIGKRIRIPKAVMQQPVSEIVDISGAKEVYYTVPTDETIYNICRRFKTTEAELLNLNPEMEGGLRAGITIRIPLRVNESELPNVTKPSAASTQTANLLRLANAPKIALLLPVDATGVQPTENRTLITEFYEGFLLAAASMVQQGFKAEVFTYEIGDKNEAKTRQLLREKNDELGKASLIIGGESPEQIKLIGDFAQQHKIKYVNPFYRNDREVNANPFIFQANTPPDYQNVTAAYAGANLFGKHNIILVDTKDAENHTEFIKAFKKELSDRNIACKEIVFDAEQFEDDLLSKLSTTKPNMIMPVSQSLAAIQKMKPVLRKIAEMSPEYNLSLYGYPLWQTYLEDCLEDFHVLDTYIYSYFYADISHPGMKQFYDDYKKWFSKSPGVTPYKYSMLGFDTGMFFFKAIHQFGVDFEERLPEMNYKSLQTGFKFARVNSEGGFINTNLYIIHFNRNYQIIRSDFR